MGSSPERKEAVLKKMMPSHSVKNHSYSVFQKHHFESGPLLVVSKKTGCDTAIGRDWCGVRLAIDEPLFAYIRFAMDKERFSFYSKKTNTQWHLFHEMHSLKKGRAFDTVGVSRCGIEDKNPGDKIIIKAQEKK